MCDTLTSMLNGNVITEDEWEKVRDYMDINAPEGHQDHGIATFWFKNSEKEPRIKWLNEQMKNLITITLLLFTTLSMSQVQLEPEKKFPRFGSEKLEFNSAMVKDTRSNSTLVNDINSKVFIKGNTVIVHFKKNVVNLKLKGQLQDVTLEGVDFIMVETDRPETLFISKNREYVMFVTERFTTNLFNR